MDHFGQVSLEVPHRPRTVWTPVLTRVSDGNDLRRLEMTSKGGAVFGFDTLCHDTLHHFLRVTRRLKTPPGRVVEYALAGKFSSFCNLMHEKVST